MLSVFSVTFLRCPYRDGGQVFRALSVVRLSLHAHRSRQAYSSVYTHQRDIDSEDKSFFNDKTLWQKAPGAPFCYQVSMTIEGAILLNLYSLSRRNKEDRLLVLRARVYTHKFMRVRTYKQSVRPVHGTKTVYATAGR